MTIKPKKPYRKILRFGTRGPSAVGYYIGAVLIFMVSIIMFSMNETFISILFFISSISTSLNGYFYKYKRKRFYGYFNKANAVLFLILIIYLFSDAGIELGDLFINWDKYKVK